jgi:hypothetical protein
VSSSESIVTMTAVTIPVSTFAWCAIRKLSFLRWTL